ncbi:MAG: PAS domain S-box protein, partial [Desulfobacteraceae bacterium]|nr:PAS domain S-box protein [Desulfobacteraceae bacterium]
MFRKPSVASWSIRSRQLLLLLTIFLPALGIVIAAGLLERQDEIGKAGDMALLLSQSLAAQQEQMAASTHEMLATLAQMPAVQQLNAKACNELFIELNRRNPRYSSISLVTPDGNLFASSIPFTAGSINLAERDHIREAVTTLDFSAGEGYVGRPGRLQSIDYALPVLDAEWKTIAVVTAGVKIDEIVHFLSRVNLSENCSIVVADRRGVSLLRVFDHKTVPAGRLIPPDFLEKVPEMAEKGVFEQVDEDGLRRIYAFKGVRLKGDAPAYLHFGVGISKEWALRAANAQMRNNLLILFFSTLMGMGLSWICSTLLITRPIHRLVATSDVFGKGDVSSRTGLPYADNEFGKLAKAFDDMAALLELREKERDRAEEALREANADLETRVLERTLALSDINATLKSEIEDRRRAESALEEEAILRRTLMNQLRDGIVVLDQDGRVFEANRAFSAMLGYSAEEIGHLHVWDWDALMTRESLEEAIRLVDSSGDHFVTRHRRKDGSTFDVEITSTA